MKNKGPTAADMAPLLGLSLAQTGSVMALCQSCREGAVPDKKGTRWTHQTQPAWGDYPVICDASDFRRAIESGE